MSSLIIQSHSIHWGQVKSSHRCSITKAALKNFAISTGKYLCWRLFLIKNFKETLSKGTPTQVFSCEYCGIFKITCFEEHLQTAASMIRCYFDTINLKQSGFCTTYSLKILVSEGKI